MKTNNNYTFIKNIFIENSEIIDFINLDKSMMAYRKILNSLQKSIKLILFYGNPGCGKTFLLNKIKSDLNDNKIIFLREPFFSEREFYTYIFYQIFKQNIKIKHYEQFIRMYKQTIAQNASNSDEKPTIILLDEAHLYPKKLVEKIRLLSDGEVFKFLFTTHKTGKKNVFEKEYFKTRIWENIELENLNFSETCLYIEKKLLLHGFQRYFLIFSSASLSAIFKLSNGNLRNINKLMYKIFEICEYYEENSPWKINFKENKIIEMAAIGVGFLYA